MTGEVLERRPTPGSMTYSMVGDPPQRRSPLAGTPMHRLGEPDDIGHAAVLKELASIAPVTAVRGNNDRGPWAETVREVEVLQVDHVFIYVVHNLAELDLDPVAAGFQVIVSGHSHKPSVEERDGVLYVNPGSSGPRRFKLPVALAELTVNGNSVRARVVELDVEK